MKGNPFELILSSNDRSCRSSGCAGSKTQLRLSGTALCALVAGQSADALAITPTFASNITSDPNAVAIEGTINTAISTYEADFIDPINVAITFQEMANGLGASSTTFFNVSYPTYHTALVADATTANDTTALTRLAVDGSGVNNPITGNSTINGAGPGTGIPDGIIGLNTHITSPGSPGATWFRCLSQRSAKREPERRSASSPCVRYWVGPCSAAFFQLRAIRAWRWQPGLVAATDCTD